MIKKTEMIKTVLNRKKNNILIISQIISTVFQRIFTNTFQRNSVIKKPLEIVIINSHFTSQYAEAQKQTT